jgi:carbamoyl-phosphate synthase large subunit
MRILTEASGGLTSAYLLKAIHDAGHQAIGSDISDLTAAHCLADDFIRLPGKDDPSLWQTLSALLHEHSIDAVIPSLDEMMAGWAERQQCFAAEGIKVIISPQETIRTCQDKWATYQFFRSLDIPTPATSLNQDHPLIKPRQGRGSTGIEITTQPVTMEGRISQTIAGGEEITIDALFDNAGHPVYIIPRRRLQVRNGKSTMGETLQHDGIDSYIRRMARSLRFIGPINFQCFIDGDDVQFIEINPRIAGGMALGFAASENWITPMMNNLIHNRPIQAKPVRYGLKMIRYYAECFIS